MNLKKIIKKIFEKKHKDIPISKQKEINYAAINKELDMIQLELQKLRNLIDQSQK